MAALRAYWLRSGPPAHIGIAVIADALGVKLTSDEAVPEAALEPPADGPSIAEIAALIDGPAPGGDTLKSSLAAMRAFANPKE